MPRRTQLRKALFVKYGYTMECPGCQWLRNPYGNPRNHSEDCRAGVEDLMGKDEEERAKLQHATDRIDEYVAKQGEEHIDYKKEEEHD